MSDAPAPADPITLGALSLRFDSNGAFAREISVGGEELFRGIGFVVRDANWGTPALPSDAVFSRQDGRLTAHSRGELTMPGGDLAWSVEWSITEDGIEATCRVTSATGFETNRTGFVVLHSLGATRGRPVTVSHPGGEDEEAVFPERVSPHQPVLDIEALEYATAAGTRLRLTFTGDVFEMEDQRNWTDASYKTYCRPLRLPYPYRISPSAAVEQSVRVEILASAPAVEGAPTPTPYVERTAILPALGASLPPGPLESGQIEALHALKLGFTAIEIDLAMTDALETAAAKIAAVPGPLRIDVREGGTSETFAAVETLAPRLAGRTALGLSLWDADAATLAAARAAAPGMRIGAGTGSYFTELNRMVRWPAADYLTWTSNPTVHGSNDDTIGETTEPLADIIRAARARSSAAKFQIGPMTLGFRFDPHATTPEGRRISAPADPRQGGMIAAAWMAATIAGFLDDAVETLAFFEPRGAKGLLSAAGAWTPAAWVLSRLAPLSGREASVVRWSGVPRAVGLSIDAPEGRALCFAHPRGDTFALPLPPGAWARVERLTADGFVEVPPPEFRAEPFGVFWLTE